MSSSSTTPEAGQQPEPTPSPPSPEEAAEADAIWAERDRRIAARCHVVLGAHHNVNGHCLYCSKPMTVADALTSERLAEIRSTLLGEWLAGGWRVRSVPSPDGGRDRSEVYLPGSAAVIATFPDWADSVAVFLADAHEAVPELLAEVERLTARVAELEPKGDAEFPPRGGHKNLCAYAAGMSGTCTCDVTAGGAR